MRIVWHGGLARLLTTRRSGRSLIRRSVRLKRILPRLCLTAATLLLASAAHAQGFGPQPNPYQPNPYQPAPGPQPGQAGAPSLVGTWSGQSSDPNGTIEDAQAFGPDGRFVDVLRLPNGFLARLSGTYRATQVGPNQLRVVFQLESWLPRETCQQEQGGQPQCQPTQFPSTDTSLVTFISPDRFQAISETTAGPPENAARDNQPALLQAQAPQRWITIVQPAAPAPVPVNPRPYYPSTAPRPVGKACPNDDIQINICKYSGTLVTSGGCLRCVGG